ncbi:MAG: type II toxin-antitoxin system VapC family toxin, partial [Sedimenticola sp.]
GLDTNILARYIIQDDPVQAARATTLIENSCSAENPGYISSIVLCELVWVLSRGYRYEKSITTQVLQQLLTSSELAIEQWEASWAALRKYKTGTADFSDYLIGQLNHTHHCKTTYTFDRKAAQGLHFTLLE